MTTRLLRAMRAGDSRAASELFARVHHELHEIAGRLMARQAPSHTLQPTALLNEAWLRLSGGATVDVEDRVHFVRVAARAMRQILMDHARAKRSNKRHHGENADVDPDQLITSFTRNRFELLDLDEALAALAIEDPRLAEIVELRLFGGLTLEETGEVLQLTLRQVHRSWTFARSWLRRRLASGELE
ncbi:MAG: ECF-type sigma factor [Planctomycetota bacterium]